MQYEHAIFLRNLTSNFAGRQNYLREEKIQGRVKIYSVLFRRPEISSRRAHPAPTRVVEGLHPARYFAGTMLTLHLPEDPVTLYRCVSGD